MERTFTVDWDNLNQIKDLQQTLAARSCKLSNLKDKTTRKYDRKQKEFDACLEIYNKNLENLFVKNNSDSDEYYTYLHCNPMEPMQARKNAKFAFAATLGVDFLSVTPKLRRQLQSKTAA
jgi:hypothetical protein